MSDVDRKAPYDRFRFRWKQELLEDLEVPIRSHRLAMVLCDTFVNRHTGLCWPSNRTLAEKLRVDVRTVQRNLEPLLKLGYLSRMRVRGRRRVYKISIPERAGQVQHERDGQGGDPHDIQTTRMTHKDDTNAPPNKNIGKNNKENLFEHPQKYIPVPAADYAIVSAWKKWVAENMDVDVQTLFGYLTNANKVSLPDRYADEKSRGRYIDFFSKAFASRGSIFR